MYDNYNFSYPGKESLSLLFISRLYNSKDIPTLFNYFDILKKKLKKNKKVLTLNIIGDGPLRDFVIEWSDKIEGINYIGPLTKETEIAPYMEQAICFYLGGSGLSINHAFAYGRPYATIPHPEYGPEISFIKNDYNGFILSGNKQENIEKLYNFLNTYQNIYMIMHTVRVRNYQ